MKRKQLPPPDGRWHYWGSNDDGRMLWVYMGSHGIPALQLHTVPTALYRAMTVGRLA